MTSLQRIVAWGRRPAVWLAAVVLILLIVLVAAPLARLVGATLGPGAEGSWTDVLASPMSAALFWQPLGGSLLVGIGTGAIATIVGVTLAWIVVMTDVPGRKIIGIMASIPFALPSFAIALAWESVFRNDLIGGTPGLLSSMGIAVPDWLAWGPVPVTLTLVAHYYSLSFVVTAAALANIGGDLVAAAEITGASRFAVATRIVVPAVTPAVLAGFLLAFAEGVSNFAVPALLGMPVRFHTLSTRLYGSISTGDAERGYVLSILLVLIAGIILFVGNRIGGGRSFSTITGKAAAARVTRTGAWRWPLALCGWGTVLLTAVMPAVILAMSTLLRRTNSLEGGFTLHYWIGASDSSISQGMRGVLQDPAVLRGFGGTIVVGLSVAVGAVLLGLLAAIVIRALPRARMLRRTIALLSYVPFLIPGVALGAAFIVQFSAPIGPFGSLYGTFGIIILAGIAASVPFAFQTANSALGQISKELDEAALLTGASGSRRLARISAPLVSRGLANGAVLVFVTMVRDLSVVVLLVTPATPLLSMLTFRYASEGFAQHASAITLIIAVISVAATLAARLLERGAKERRPV